MTSESSNTAALVDEWRKAMEGVPDCQWHHTEDGEVYVDERQQICCGRGHSECCGQPAVTGDYYALANTSATTAPWIARCSPSGISALLDALSAQAKELEEARQLARHLRVAQIIYDDGPDESDKAQADLHMSAAILLAKRLVPWGDTRVSDEQAHEVINAAPRAHLTGGRDV